MEAKKIRLFTQFRAIREPDVLAVMHAAEAIDEGHWTMRCPGHSGAGSSSLEVTLSAGRYTLKCYYGCTTEKIIQGALDHLDDKCNRCEASQIADATRKRNGNAACEQCVKPVGARNDEAPSAA